MIFHIEFTITGPLTREQLDKALDALEGLEALSDDVRGLDYRAKLSAQECVITIDIEARDRVAALARADDLIRVAFKSAHDPGLRRDAIVAV